MNQQVNLYLPEFRPSRDWLTAANLLIVTAVVCLLLAGVSGYDQWRLGQLQQQQSRLQSQLDQQTRETEALEQQLEQREGNARLEQELETRRERLQRTSSLLDFLQGARLGNTIGFSPMMKDLARASFDGLWLTGVDIRDGGDTVSLAGRALRSAMVPDFIGRLSNGESELHSRRFNRFLGQRGEEASAADDESGARADAIYAFELEAR